MSDLTPLLLFMFNPTAIMVVVPLVFLIYCFILLRGKTDKETDDEYSKRKTKGRIFLFILFMIICMLVYFNRQSIIERYRRFSK